MQSLENNKNCINHSDKMKLYFSILACFLTILTNLIGQDTPSVNLKGVKPTNDSVKIKTGTTRAVIIGISNYQNEKIPDLQYAHKDAKAFKAYLQSEAGGKVADGNIEILTDENATMGKMAMALEWLMEVSEENDKAIIYFSGHGDVEKKTAMQHGFLLTHDSPANVYVAGAFPIFYLQAIIATLSGNSVQTLMITDACRAGKLAGNATNGTQSTNNALAQQFANEIKILSCQPNEYSVEGEQWGAGRGCFSYHLINGLMGLADKNQDAVVSLKEIERYLEDKVAEEVAPQQQNPFTIGNKMAAIAKVDATILADLKAKEQFNNPQFSEVKGKGALTMVGLNERFKNWVYQFKAKLEEGNLLHPKKACAAYFYNKIITEATLQPFHAQMTRAYAAALIDESQQYINQMLEGDGQLIDAFAYTRTKNVNLFPSYLNKAASLLTERHYLYNHLKQKEYFFKGVALKNQLLTEKQSKRKEKKLIKAAFKTYQKALSFDSTAAYVHLALAKTYSEQSNFDKSIPHINKAIYYAPRWTLAIATKGVILSQQGKLKEALAAFEQAIQKDSSQLYIYQWAAKINQELGNQSRAKEWNQLQINQIENLNKTGNYPTYYNGLLAMAYSENGAYEQATPLFQQAIVESNHKDAALLQAQAQNYYWLKDYDAAKISIQKALNIFADANSLSLLAMIDLKLANYKSAKKALKKALKKDNQFALAYAVNGDLYAEQKEWQKAEQQYIIAFNLNPRNRLYWLKLMGFYEAQQVSAEKLYDFYQKVASKNRDNQALIKTFALAFQRLGYKEKAKKLITKTLLSN